jgi:hypothetical protein
MKMFSNCKNDSRSAKEPSKECITPPLKLDLSDQQLFRSHYQDLAFSTFYYTLRHPEQHPKIKTGEKEKLS